MAPKEVTIGILAMQGAFSEHQAMFQKLSPKKSIIVVLVRTPEELAKCDALVIPGGESTTIALLAQLGGLWEPLRDFARAKPIWGTCAGAILLSQSVENTKKGGQELLGGISVVTARNGFGPQVESFEVPLSVQGLRDSQEPFTGIFIRAPVVLSLNDPQIQIIARLAPELLPKNRAVYMRGNANTVNGINANVNSNEEIDANSPQTIVALRQGHHLLTTFHPELTRDERFHEYFVREFVWPSVGACVKDKI